MIIYTEKNAYECASAEQCLDGVHLLNEDGSIFVVIAQPNRIQKVEGGEIVVVEQPEPSPSDDSVWDEMDAAYQEGVDSV